MKLPNTNTEDGQREASAILARLRGWELRFVDEDGVHIPIWYDKERIVFPPFGDRELNLYDPAHMALAWRVLNWANNQSFGGLVPIDIRPEWHNFIADLRLSPPEQAMKLAMDRILLMADESGMLG